jgi:aspartate/methionine/tyrosine aminotransferase
MYVYIYEYIHTVYICMNIYVYIYIHTYIHSHKLLNLLHLFTGACRLVGEFIAKFMGNGNEETVIYMPDPTWGNHIPIMKNSGLKVVFYRYFEPKTKGFDFTGMMADVKAAKNGSAFLLHACAHNPTGCDPNKSQWDELSALMLQKKHIVFFDSAYQGFARYIYLYVCIYMYMSAYVCIYIHTHLYS